MTSPSSCYVTRQLYVIRHVPREHIFPPLFVPVRLLYPRGVYYSNILYSAVMSDERDVRCNSSILYGDNSSECFRPPPPFTAVYLICFCHSNRILSAQQRFLYSQFYPDSITSIFVYLPRPDNAIMSALQFPFIT